MSQLRRFSSCLVVAGCLIPGMAWGAPPVAPSDRSDRSDREEKAVELYARGGDATALRDQIAREGAVPHARQEMESREAADLRGALETMARQSHGLATNLAARRAALPAQELTGLLATYDRLRTADFALRARFRGAGERIAAKKLAGGAAGRLAAAEAAYAAAVERILNPLSAPAEAARKALQNEKTPAFTKAAADLARAFEAVEPALGAATQPVMHPILRASELPYRRTGLAPRAPVTAPVVQPSYQDPAGAQPTGADRSGTAQAPLSPEILARAAELGHDYTRIYQFVRNSIRTEWYAGAMKGAAGTLLQGSGNDVDQASLLIALLRASDAPARYVHGVVELPVDAVAESLGVPAASVPTALARAGVAVTPVVRGGKVAAVQVEQTWVSAYVPYTNYRGAVVDFSGKTWVPLAPARKGVADVLPTGILRRMGYSVDGAIASTLAAPQTADPLSTIRRDVEAWLAGQAPGQTWDGQLGSRSIKPESLELLPSSLPMTVVAVTGEEADLATAEIHRLRLLARSGDAADAPVILDLTLPLAAVASHRLTLSYLPATVDDQITIDSFGGLSLVPPYLVKLRPQIRLDGRAVAVATGEVDMAAAHTFEILVDGPFGEERIEEAVVAGGYYALGVSAQQARHHVASADEVLDPADDEYLAARLLSQIALGYSERWDQGEAALAGLLSVSVVRPLPTVAVAGTAVTVESAFGLPQSLRFDGVTLDASLRVAEPLARTTDAAGTTAPRDWMRLSALEGSALEHAVFEQDFLVDSISADKGLGVAHQAGMDVLHIDAQNAATVLPTLQQPDAVKQEIQDWVRQGMTVDVPRGAITRAAWQGSVWRVDDPVSGGGGYFISGGLAGGATAVTPDAWVLGFLADVLRSPYSTGPNTNPRAGVLLRKVAGSDKQLAEVDKDLVGPLEAIVTDLQGRPVKGARVTFTSVEGGGHLTNVDHAEVDSLTVLTDFRGIASAPFKLGQHTADNPVFIRINAIDINTTQALEHLVDVTAESLAGPLVTDSPFEVIGYPGLPVELKRTDREGTIFNATTGVAMWADTLAIQARDRLGNPVSNIDVTFAVDPVSDHYAPCENQPRSLVSAVVFDPAVDATGKLLHCPNQHPLLGDCGQGVLKLKTSSTGVSAGLILGNSVNYIYTVNVAADRLAPLRFSYSEVVVENGSTHYCGAIQFRLARFVPTDERGDPVTATRAGHALAQPVEAGLLYWRPSYTVESRPILKPDGSAGREYYRHDLMDGRWDWITGNVVFHVGNGGQASPAVLTAEQTYRTTVTTGPTPAANPVSLYADQLKVTYDDVDPNTGQTSIVTKVLPPLLYRIEGPVLDVWGIEPKIVAVVPSPVPLTTSRRAAEQVIVGYTVDPPAYASSATEMDLFASGVLQGTAVGTSRSGSGLANIQRGYPFAAGSRYEAELVVNRGTPFEVHSDRFLVPTHSGLFFNIHGPGNGLSDGTGAILLSQEVDLVNQRYCAKGGGFHFDLAQPARVTLSVRKLDAIETDGSSIYGPPSVLFADLPLAAGGHDYSFGPGGFAGADYELLPGSYQLAMRGVAADGSVDTAQVPVESEYRTRDSLPIGHTLVQGVDLWDGHLSLSREDFRIPGRGSSLEFMRTYSSGGDDSIGPLGASWSHNYVSRVTIGPCGEVIVIGAEGGAMRFVSDGSGGFKPLKGFHGTLLLNPAAGGFDFYSKNGTHYRYAHGIDNEFPLAWIQDPDGNTTTLEYDKTADVPQLAAVHDAAGRTLSFKYDRRQFYSNRSGPVLVQVTGPEGISLSFDYDVFGNLIRAAREGDSRVETYTYAVPPAFDPVSRHQLTDVTNVLNGAVTHYDFSQGAIGLQGDVKVPTIYVTKVREPEGGETTFAFDQAALSSRTTPVLTATVIDPRQKVTTYTLNQYGSPLTITDPLHHTTTMEWSQSDVLLMSRTDARGTVTRFTYDTDGNQLTESVNVTDVEGTIHAYTTETEYWPPATFNPPYIKDRVKTHKDRNGTVTTTSYDTHGHLTGQQVIATDIDGGQQTLTTVFTYLSNGDLASIQDPRNNVTSLAYDPYGNPSIVTDSRHGVTVTQRNARSLPVLVRDALGRETRQDYDTLGRPTTKTLPQVVGEQSAPTETVVYDDIHNQVTMTDAEGRVTHSTADRQGRLLEVVNPLGAAKNYEYDLAGNKVKESNWHDASTPRTDGMLTYDDAGRVSRRAEPLGRVTEYTYDEVGNLTRETLRDDSDPGFTPRIVEFRYDALNRKIQEDRALGTGVVSTLIELDGNGNKVKEADALGRITNYRYDALNRLIEKLEPEWKTGSRKTTRFLYDGNSNVIEERRLNLPADQIHKAEYDELNRPRKRTNAEGQATLSEYDAVGNLTRQIDARLDVVKNDYDARNHLIQRTVLLNRVTQPGRQVVTGYSYDKVGNRTLEIWPNGNQVHSIYDGLNRVLSTTDNLGTVSVLEYDANGNKTVARDANGHETHNTYDALFRLIQQDLPAQRMVHTTFDVAGNKTSQTDPRGHVSQFQYDRLNRLVKTIDPAPFLYETSYSYDPVGNKTDETDRRGHTTHFDYDVLNRLVKHTDPAPFSYVMTYVYDAVGNRVSETDRRGIVTESSYDRENRLTQTKRAGLVIQATEYDEAGNKLFVTDANGNTTGWEYDERNLVTAENRPLAAITHITRDDMGDPASEIDPEGRATTYTHDPRRRMSAETNFANETTTYSYDLKGNRTGVTHPKLNAWAYRYDAADRLQEVEDPLHAVTAYAYDQNSNRTTQADANHHATSFEYDELNRVTAMVYPDQAREIYHYDENGNRTEQVDPKGQHIFSAYDEINRETLRTYPATGAGGELQSIATAYDANNNPLTITETFAAPGAAAVTTKTYDDFDRLTTVTDRYGKKLLYVYDANGNRKSLQDPDAKVTRYDYDALNRLTAVTLTGAGVTNYDYYRDSRLKQVNYPNGTVAANTYDAATRVATITNRQAATVVSSYAYQYDKNGNRTQQIEVNGGAPETTTYQFDGADRLTQVSYPDKTVAYTYDAEGNRQTEQVRDAQNTRIADKTSTYDVRNRLLSTADALSATAGVTYTYDANGNRTSRLQGSATTDLVYDVRDQLTEVRTNSTLLESYAYDYRGMRVRKAGSGALLRYVYDDKSVLLQTDDFGNTLSKYDYGPDRLLALTNAAQGRQFYLFDALGSVADLMTPGGGIQARYQYDAWGNDRRHTGTSANIFGFTGHELDTATGLYYFKARFYDPETGLFLTEDPFSGSVENPPSLHRFLYAFANPTVYVDPNGEAGEATIRLNEKGEPLYGDDGQPIVDYAEAIEVKANGQWSEITGWDVQDALLPEGYSISNASAMVIKAGLGKDIGADKTKIMAPYVVTSGRMIEKMMIRTGVIGLSGGLLGPMVAEWGLPWWIAEPSVGAVTNDLGQAAVDVSNGRVSSVNTYLWTTGEGAGGALIFGGLTRGVSRWFNGEPTLGGGAEETIVTEEASGGGTSRKDYANHGSDSFDDGARMVEQPFERSKPAAAEEVRPEIQNDDSIDVRSGVAEAEAPLAAVDRRTVRGPVAGGGADLNNLSANDVTRIQNAANRTKQEITVFGSRAGGTATEISDWDYILSGKSAQRHSARSSLPRGTEGGEINGCGAGTGIDIFQSYNPGSPSYRPVPPRGPHIIFFPQ